MNIRHALISLLMVGNLAILPAPSQECGQSYPIYPADAHQYSKHLADKVADQYNSKFQDNYRIAFIPRCYQDILFDSIKECNDYWNSPRVVEIQVDVRPTGYLQTVKVTRPSGDKEFDLAVTEAVKRAAPYGAAKVATRIGLCVRAPEETETKAKLILNSK